MLAFKTAGYNGYSVKYSPFYDNKLAVATSANYGLVGNGKLWILSIAPNGQITPDTAFETQDGLFDVSWSEIHENQLLTSSGDGTISLFDTTLPQFPITKFQEHTREVFSVYWNLVDKTMFCSSSWDGTVKVWNPNQHQSIMTLATPKDQSVAVDSIPLQQKQAAVAAQSQRPPLSANKPTPDNPNNDCVYQAQFSPHNASLILSVNSASHCQLWDIRQPQPLSLDFISHGGLETLACDFNKYRPTVVATASVDKSIKIWDLRMIPNVNHSFLPHGSQIGPSPLNKLVGHDFAVRKVTWSPHTSDGLLSCSYDMTCRVWRDFTDDKARFLNSVRLRQGQELVNTFDRHHEFVMGCDWSLWGAGFAASVGWDEMVYVWKAA